MQVSVSINFDFDDFKGLLGIMSKYGNVEQPFCGRNENSELVLIFVSCNNIVTETHQQDGYVRKNVYWNNGDIQELMTGKWRDMAR